MPPGLVWIAGNTSYTSSTNGGYVSTGQLVFNGGLSQTINGDVINANRVEVDTLTALRFNRAR